jgi:hypothetical protein
VILVESETSEAKPLAVGDAGKTLGESAIVDHTAGVLSMESVKDEILLDVNDFWHLLIR